MIRLSARPLTPTGTTMRPEPWDSVFTALDAFDASWQRRPTPPLEDHLPPPDHRARRQTLAGLACIDLERRLKAGMGTRAEDYVRWFPELADDPEGLTELVVLEYEQRRRTASPCSSEELLSRFPQLAARLQARLQTIRRTEATPATAGAAGTAGSESPSTQADRARAAALGCAWQAAGLDLRNYELLEQVGRG